MADKTIQILLQLLFESKGEKDAKQGLSDIDREIERGRANIDRYVNTFGKLGVQLEGTKRDLDYLRQASTQAQSAITNLGIVSGAAFAALTLESKNYVDKIGYLETTSTRWLVASDRIENANVRIGRSITTSLNPALEGAAGLIERLAALAEQNPELVDIGTRGTLLVVGAVGVIGAINQGVKSLSTIGSIIAGLADNALFASIVGAGGIATVLAALGPALGILGAIGGGAVLGGTAYELAAKSDVGKKAGLQDLEHTATVGAYGLGELFGKIAGFDEKEIERKSLVFAAVVAHMTGVISDADFKNAGRTLAPTPTDTLSDRQAAFAEKNSGIYYDYLQNQKKLDEQYQKQSTQITEQYGQQRVELERTYDDQRTKAMQQFSKSEKDAEADYYRSRKEAAKGHSKETQRAEEDHQRRMLELAQQHDQRVYDLSLGRDALGLVREQRSYEQQRQGEENSYQLEARRRSADYADQVKQLEQSFRTQRERRLRDFNDQVRERDQQHAREMAQLDAHEKDATEKLKQSYNEQGQLLYDAMINRVRSIDATILGDYAAFQRGAQEMQGKFLRIIQGYVSQAGMLASPTGAGQAGGNKPVSKPGNKPPLNDKGQYEQRATGGYAGSGLYELGERGREFVLNNDATRAAEAIMGSRLTQENLISAMVANRRANGGAGGAGSRALHLHVDGNAVKIDQLSGILNQRDKKLMGMLETILGEQ